MKNWKTTLLGLLAGTMMMVGGAIKEKQANPNASPVTFGNLAPAIALAALGLASKDHDSTGGTR